MKVMMKDEYFSSIMKSMGKKGIAVMGGSDADMQELKDKLEAGDFEGIRNLVMKGVITGEDDEIVVEDIDPVHFQEVVDSGEEDGVSKLFQETMGIEPSILQFTEFSVLPDSFTEVERAEDLLSLQRNAESWKERSRGFYEQAVDIECNLSVKDKMTHSLSESIEVKNNKIKQLRVNIGEKDALIKLFEHSLQSISKKSSKKNLKKVVKKLSDLLDDHNT